MHYQVIFTLAGISARIRLRIPVWLLRLAAAEAWLFQGGESAEIMQEYL